MRAYTLDYLVEGKQAHFVVDLFRSPLEACDTMIQRSADVLSQPRTSPILPTCERQEWYGVTGRDDLRNKCAVGLDDPLADALSRTLSSLRTEETLRPIRRRWDVAGGSLSVPRYLSGDPLMFRHRVKGRARSRTLEVVILPSIDCTVSVSESQTVGRCMGMVLGYLRGMGYAIGISTVSMGKFLRNETPDHIHGMDVRIKAPSDMFNPRKISFALSRVLSRALFLGLLMQDPIYLHSYNRILLPPIYDDVLFDIIDTFHPGAKIVFDANDLIDRLRSGWSEDRCVDLLLSSVTDYRS